MKRNPKHSLPTAFTDEFKRKIVSEYIESELSKTEILAKYQIKSNSAIQSWMRKFGVSDPYVKTDRGIPNHHRLKKKKTDLTEVELQNQALLKRIKEMEKDLGEEKLRSEMFVRIIEIAEKDYKLNIRKKPDTK
jgi:transposase